MSDSFLDFEIFQDFTHAAVGLVDVGLLGKGNVGVAQLLGNQFGVAVGAVVQLGGVGVAQSVDSAVVDAGGSQNVLEPLGKCPATDGSVGVLFRMDDVTVVSFRLLGLQATDDIQGAVAEGESHLALVLFGGGDVLVPLAGGFAVVVSFLDGHLILREQHGLFLVINVGIFQRQRLSPTDAGIEDK